MMPHSWLSHRCSSQARQTSGTPQVQALAFSPDGTRVATASRDNTARIFDATTGDRKSTRLNSSHSQISYAVFCLKKKKQENDHRPPAGISTSQRMAPANARLVDTSARIYSRVSSRSLHSDLTAGTRIDDTMRLQV